ncbi:MAG: tryptophan--tRNA ligase [Alphaproteobacteria bacterium]|nr:tryptophan--tRNA ligase [Alphaproteobacteria bacterium]MDE6571410.1 tryptophan--tRNA ligase [Alphaproteobacteria bacterium]
MAKDIILTGIRPTGPLHIGHMVGALWSNIEMQNAGGYDKMYAMIADAQGLTDNFDNPAKVRDNVMEITLDMLATGYDPAKTTMFIQSEVAELTELTFYYMNLVTVARLQRNPTVKTEIAQKEKFNGGVPAGFFTYPISQAADITAFNANIVPVGDDQLPMLEQACEIVHKFNSIYGDTLVMPRAIVPQLKSAARLPGIDGNAKMSKSLNNGIYLKDSSDDIAAKVRAMFTDPNHLRVEDPGNTRDNPVFIYLSVFAKPEHFAAFLPEYKNYDELAAHYERGGLGDVKVKKFLNAVLQETLQPIRERRELLARDPGAVLDILRRGTRDARDVAADTVRRVKRAMKLNYFD